MSERVQFGAGRLQCEKDGHDLNADRSECLRCGMKAPEHFQLLKFPFVPPQAVVLTGTVVSANEHEIVMKVD